MPWAKGQSGNPGGRPKGYEEVRAAARAHGPAAIKALAKALKDERLCVTAAVALLDRGFGKPGHAEGEADNLRGLFELVGLSRQDRAQRLTHAILFGGRPGGGMSDATSNGHDATDDSGAA